MGARDPGSCYEADDRGCCGPGGPKLKSLSLASIGRSSWAMLEWNASCCVCPIYNPGQVHK